MHLTVCHVWFTFIYVYMQFILYVQTVSFIKKPFFHSVNVCNVQYAVYVSACAHTESMCGCA